MADLSVTGEVVVTSEKAEAAFDRVGDKATQMANEVTTSAGKAGQAVDGMGDSAEKSAEKFTRADSLMRAAIMKSTRELELLGKTASQRFEAQIDLKGLEKAKFQEAISGLQAMESALSVAKAREAEFAAQNAFSLKAAQAKELVKASEYARWWAQELEKVEAAEKRLAGQNSFIASLKSQADAIGKTKADLLEMQAAQMGVATQAAPFIAKMREAEAGVGKMGISAAQTAAALRGVPAQFTDIITSLQGGQAPLTVFLQQGGQLRDLFGGAGAAARALGGYVVGLINPFTLAAAGAAALAVAYNQGSQEADAYRLAMVGTGNAAGTTAGQLKSYAQEISGVVGTQGKAAESLAAFVSTGRVSRDVLKEASQAAIAWERATGQAVGTTAKQFAELGKDPLQAVLKLNEGTNFLTESVYKQIKSLEEQGRAAEAAAVAQRAYADALTGRSATITQNLGYIEKAWQGITGAAKKGWDAMLNVGRASTPADATSELRARLTRQQEELAAKKAINPYADTSGMEKGIEILKQRLGLLESDERQTRRNAEAEAARAAQNAAAFEWDKEGAKYLSEKAKLERELTKARNEGLAAGKSQAEIEQRLAQIRESYAKKGGSSVAAENKELRDQQRIFADLAGVSSTYYAELANYQKQRASGVATEEQYVVLVEQLIQKQPFAVALEKDRAEAIKESAKAAAESSKALGAWYEVREKESQGLQNQINARREEVSMMGMTTEAVVAYTQAKYEQQAAEKEAYAAALESASFYAGEYAEAYKTAAEAARQQAAQLRELGGLEVEKANKEAAKKAAQEWERAAADIERALTDSLMRGFESGKDFAENLIASLKNMFSTLVLRPIISAVMSPVSMAINGVVNSAVGSVGSSFLSSAGGSMLGNMAGGLGAFTGAMGSGFSMAMSGGMGLALEGGAAMLGSATGMSSALAGIGQIAGALGPIALGIGALYAIVSSLDDSGTLHTGGAAQYSAARGLTSGQDATGYNIGFGRVEAGAQTISAVSGIAQALGTALDGVAVAFGQKAGYEIATAFADDTSEDGAWGALRISRDGQDLLNWENNRQSRWAPREFGDGEAGYKEYLAAVAKDTRQVLLDMDLPSWADKLLTSIGESASMEQLTGVLNQIGVVQSAFVALGRSMEMFSGLTDEMQSGLLEAAGSIDTLTASAGAFYQNFYSEQERLDAASRQLRESFESIGLTLPATKEAFRALVDAQDLTTESGRKTYAALLQVSGAFAQVTDASQAAALAAQQAAQAAADAAREQAQRAVDVATNAAQSALSGLRDAVAAEQDRLQARFERESDILNDRIGAISGVIATLDNAIRSIRGSIESTSIASQTAARLTLQSVLTAVRGGQDITGFEPVIEQASETLTRNDPNLYQTREQFVRAQAQSADLLDSLNKAGGKQLTLAELQLKALEDGFAAEVARLDDLVTQAEKQINALLGIKDGTLSVEAAVREVEKAIGTLASAVSAQMAAAAAASYSVSDTPAERQAKVESNTGVKVSSSDPALVAAAKVLYQSINGGASTAEYNAASAAVGGNIAAAVGWDGTRAGAERLRDIYGFARGGYYPGGLALVGEEGPELINFKNPGQVYTAPQTESMLDNSAVVAELKALRSEVIELRAQARRTADAVNGNPEAPMLVETVA